MRANLVWIRSLNKPLVSSSSTKMSAIPQFWHQIREKLQLESFEGIEEIRDVLNFMGYSTAKSIAKLRKEKEFCHFQIEVGKLKANASFCAKHPNLKDWDLGLGTIQVLKDITSAAAYCTSFSCDDTDAVQKTVFERCQKVWIYLYCSYRFDFTRRLKTSKLIFCRLQVIW